MSNKSTVIRSVIRMRQAEVYLPKKVRNPLGFNELRKDVSPLPLFGKRETILMPSVMFGIWRAV